MRKQRYRTSIKCSLFIILHRNSHYIILYYPYLIISISQVKKKTLRFRDVKRTGPADIAESKSNASLQNSSSPGLLPSTQHCLFCSHYLDVQGPWVGSGTGESPRLADGLSPASPLLTHSRLTSPGPIFITATSRLCSALWGPCLRCLVTQGLLCKFLLSTLDLIAAINTNYASLSVKLRRTRLKGSSSIQSWKDKQNGYF